MSQVKICGIRSLEAAEAALTADMVGLNFVPTSKRRIDLVKAQQLTSLLKQRINIVGVFQNQTQAEIQRHIDLLNLDFIQLHGEESPEFTQNFTIPVIKAFRVPSDFDLETTRALLSRYPVTYMLLDREVQSRGEPLPYEKVAVLSREFPIILAGGLTPQNVTTAIRQAHPFAVDVAGGVEVEGQESPETIRQFISTARAAIV